MNSKYTCCQRLFLDAVGQILNWNLLLREECCESGHSSDLLRVSFVLSRKLRKLTSRKHSSETWSTVKTKALGLRQNDVTNAKLEVQNELSNICK